MFPYVDAPAGAGIGRTGLIIVTFGVTFGFCAAAVPVIARTATTSVSRSMLEVSSDRAYLKIDAEKWALGYKSGCFV
jgi:hypothetical protein